MDEQNENKLSEKEYDEDDELELNHTDKLVGVFTEPSSTFEKMSNFPPKATDWFLPLILLIVIAIVSNFVMMSNPAIKYQVMEKQIGEMEKRFDKMVEDGTLSREQADQQLEATRNFMESGGATGQAIQSVGIVIVSFIIFFVVSLAFWLAAKFGLKGEGTYTHSMVAYGLPYYIAIIQTIFVVLVAFITDKFMTGLSVAEFVDVEKSTLVGFLLSKLDVFSIWFYAVVAIGFARMFKSESTGKYYAMVFGMWIGFGLLFFFLAKAVPFLGFLNQ
ncbi:MAG: YIP1 family protein [Melioribacteraceae bacterium]|nr:YIP1 family protein [Melioribacteraceae bacterium]MCF8265566.1 YIP1 family protein [Melioribacteraceae bacterium]MCF8413878.1 YIP1 family protein [Melioribacteraceae bacterium]MCF8430952.1 YIP1 family protein [Melioribacteraceae bacterium]